MIDTDFLSENGFLKIRAIRNIKRIVQKQKQIPLSKLKYRCSMGISAEEFSTIVQAMADSGWCHLKTGALGAVTVIFNEQFNNVDVPEVSEAAAQ